jgi:sugar phosphate isomerase/epimerase
LNLGVSELGKLPAQQQKFIETSNHDSMKSFTRRSWLQTTAGFSLASLLRGAESSFSPSIGMGTYALPGYSLPDAIRLVAETGFDSIEIVSMSGYHGAPDQLPKAQRAAAKKQIGDAGLKLGALMGLPFPDAAKQAENTDWVKQMLVLANDLSLGGHPMIQGVLGGGKWDEKKALFRDCLGPWVELAKQAGVKLAIKPHRSHAMDLPQHAIWLIEQLNAADTLSMVFDYSHFIYRDLPFEEMVKISLPHTSYVVMKDAVLRDDKVQFALPGDTGTIPHAAILKQFIDGGYRGEVCAEVSAQLSKAKDYDPVQATKTCFTNLTRIAAQAQEVDFTPIFNGNDLTGWDGKADCWEVRDGEVWCTGKAKEKNWLIWRGGEPADFTLRLEFRWDKGNSGVQVRSDDLGDWHVFGYQAEIAEQEKMGFWHHSLLDGKHPKKEARHYLSTAGQDNTLSKDGTKTVKQVADAKEVQSHYHEHAWNTMEIIAKGPTLLQKINGGVFTTLTDHDTEMSRRKGWIALQDHGKGCAVAFRNLRIKNE